MGLSRAVGGGVKMTNCRIKYEALTMTFSMSSKTTGNDIRQTSICIGAQMRE